MKKISGDLIVNGNVNGLNLGNDIMRLKGAQKNMVNAYKRFQNVEIGYLYSKYMQKMDLDYILNYSLQKNKTETLYIEQNKFLKYANIYNLK